MTRRRIAAMAVVVVLAGLTLWGLGLLIRTLPEGYTVIDLTAEEGGRELLRAVLRDGERVTLSWRNSQFGLNVTEGYFTRGGMLIQDQVTFALPGGPPPARVSPGEVADLFHTGGPFDARGLNRPFSRIVFRVGEIGNPKMEAGGRTVYFKGEAGFGGRVILAVSRAGLWDRLFSR